MDEQHAKIETARKKAPRPDLEIFDDGYTKVPAFWIDELMPLAVGIPASFWKFLLVLWRDTVGIKGVQRGYVAERSMTQFHESKDTAMRWTAALAASGLFHVVYGFRHRPNEPGIPTKFKYLDGSVEEWLCFIIALRKTVLKDRREHSKETGNGVMGFRVSLAFHVDEERVVRGLPKCNGEWLAAGVKKGFIQRTEGSYTWIREAARHNFQEQEKVSAAPSSFDLLGQLGDWGPGTDAN